MTIKLHCFGESGHSYKVALALELGPLDWEPVFVDFFAGEARSNAYLSLNPMGEAPVLIDGETTLTQSGVIQGYLTEKTGQFGGNGPAEAREILRWILWDNHKLSGQLGTLRFLMNYLPEEKRSGEVIGFLKGRCRTALKVLEGALTDSEWLVGRSVSNADLTACGYLFYEEEFGFTRSDWPAIDAWLGRIEALPGWKHPYDLMQRGFPAQNGNT